MNLYQSILFALFLYRNGKKINANSWVDYFVLSFFLENTIYVDIVNVFKEKNKDKRGSLKLAVIYFPFL